MYPPFGLTQLLRCDKHRVEEQITSGNFEYTFLALGGFAYFRLRNNLFEMLQVNCLVQATTGLNRQGAYSSRIDYTHHLAKQDRFQVNLI